MKLLKTIPANVGQCLVTSKKVGLDMRNDTQAIGYIMMEMMEPGTNLENERTIVLCQPEKWLDSCGIKSFLKATLTESVSVLMEMDFIPKFSKFGILAPYVWRATYAARRQWKLMEI
jgi:hypothetical protein